MATNLKLYLIGCILFLVFLHGNAKMGQKCTFDEGSRDTCAGLFNYPVGLNIENAARWRVIPPVATSTFSQPSIGSSNLQTDRSNPFLIFNPKALLPLPSLVISCPDAVAGSTVNLAFRFFQNVRNVPNYVYTNLELSCGQSKYNVSNSLSSNWRSFSQNMPGSEALLGCNLTLPGYLQVALTFNRTTGGSNPAFIYNTPAIDDVIFTLVSPATTANPATTASPTTTTAAPATTASPTTTTAAPATTESLTTTTAAPATTASPTTTTAVPATTTTTAPATTTTAAPATTTTTTVPTTQPPSCPTKKSPYLTSNKTWVCVDDGEWQVPVQSGPCSLSCGGGLAQFTYTKCYNSSEFSKPCNISLMEVIMDCFIVPCPVAVCQVMKDKECSQTNEKYRNYVPSLFELGVDVNILGSVMGFLDVYDADSVQKQLNGFGCDVIMMNRLNSSFVEFNRMINELLSEFNTALNTVYSILDCNPGEINPMQWDRFDEIIEYISIIESVSGDVQQRQRMIEQKKINCGGQKTLVEQIAGAIRFNPI